MIHEMLKNFLIYENLDLMPNHEKNKLIQQNNELIKKINKLRMKLNAEQYNIAYLEYKKIMEPATISFLRRLMFDQQIQLQFENNLLIDFSIVDDDINIEQNILLNRLINHKKMRNIVKYLILNKYVKIFGEQQDDDTDSLETSLEKLIKIFMENSEKKMRNYIMVI